MARGKILIIEKNPRLRALARDYIKTCGYEAADAEQGPDAARILRQFVPDLVLIDQDVAMGGLKTARILRLHPSCQQVPIVITVRRDVAATLMEEGRRHGLEAFLAKPYRGEALKRKLAACINTRLDKVSVADMRAEVARLSNLPVLNANHRKMLGLLGRENDQVDLPELVRTIELDPGLTTEVLRVCHSAYYGFRGNSIEGATTFLGIDKLRKIVQASILFGQFDATVDQADDDGFSIAALWKHSVACGLIMEKSGHRVKGRDHFIAGMLHDIGKMVMCLRFGGYFEAIRHQVRAEQVSMHRAERELMGITHCDIGYELARTWDLPPTIATCIAYHHRPNETLQHKRLTSLVHLGDILAKNLGIGHGGDQVQPQLDPVAQPLAKYVFAVSKEKDAIEAEVEGMVSGTGAADKTDRPPAHVRVAS